MDNKFMAQQETYPSPTAAQTGSGVSPYQQNHQDPNDEHLDLNAQLQNATSHHDAHASMAGQAYNTAMNAQLSQPAPTYGYPAATPVPFQGTIPGITGPSPQTPDDPARKKTKVTRACDECRRKKIKCDAASDAPGAPKCSNCVRTNADCKFSRAPQKRGPSKGYIKELSDRVAQLEGSRTGFDDSSGVLVSLGSNDRKRTFSMTYDGNSYDQDPAFPPSNLARSFAPALLSDNHVPVTSARAKSLGIELATLDHDPLYPLKPLLPVDERNMADLCGIVNRTIPMFGSSDGINSNLAHCAPPLREAFYHAIGAVVGNPAGSSGEQSREGCARSVFALMQHKGPLAEDSEAGNWETRGYQANLVYLQTLLLCVLYHQSSGPIHPDPFGTFTCSQLLEQARRMVDFLKLRHVTEPGHLGTAGDPNRVFSMARKTFWVFVILDAWHAVSTRASRQMPYFSAGTELTPQDREIFNDVSFIEFARRSTFIGSMADRLRTVRYNSPAVVDAGLDTFQALHLAFGDGAVPAPTSIDGSTNPFAGLAFATTDLLCAMLYAGPVPIPATPQIIETACKVASMLSTTKMPDQGLPLTHHFVIPTVKALLRAADYHKARSAAFIGLRDVLSAVHNNAILENNKWQPDVARVIEATLNDDKGMRGLANAAASELGEDSMGNLDNISPVFEWPAIVAHGYLNGDLSPRFRNGF